MRNSHIYYIKLGAGSQPDIAKNCITNNLLWLGYNEVPEDVIQQAINNETQCGCNDWKEAWDSVRKIYSNKNETTQTNYAKAIRQFYTATEDDYFFTFLNSTMYYCHPIGEIIPIAESNTQNGFTPGSRIRATTGWKKTPIADDSIILSERVISGKITKTKIFRGTICELTGKDKEVFFNTIQWKFPEYDELERLRKQSLELILKAIQELNAHDFEVLVDMVLTKSGWLRVGELGGTVKAIDMEYYLPVTKQTVYVQVKSVLTDTECKEAIEKLSEELSFEETALCYMAFHTNKTINDMTRSYKNLVIEYLDGNALSELSNNHKEIINWILLKTSGRA